METMPPYKEERPIMAGASKYRCLHVDRVDAALKKGLLFIALRQHGGASPVMICSDCYRSLLRGGKVEIRQGTRLRRVATVVRPLTDDLFPDVFINFIEDS